MVGRCVCPQFVEVSRIRQVIFQKANTGRAGFKYIKQVEL